MRVIYREVAIQWCSYLRREYAAVLFKANTQDQTQKLSDIKLNTNSLKQNLEVFKKVVGTSKTIGAEDLIQIIKNYCRQGDVKTSITVGVIGFPNVGKSSVINSLKKTKVASVSNVPGHTKTVQEIHLDKNVRLLDCPGVVFSDENADSALLRNVIRVEDLPDPCVPVEIIIRKVSKDTLKRIYNIEDYETTQELLANIARKRGRLLKGGIPDVNDAGRLVVKDWNAGRIPFHTPCPVTDSSSVYLINTLIRNR
jgi:nuclear GTP-binding protein